MSHRTIHPTLALLAVAFLITTTPACRHTAPVDTPAASLDSGGPLPPEQAAYDVTHYDLNLIIDPEEKHIQGTLTLQAKILSPLSQLVLNLDPRFHIHHIQLHDPIPDNSKPSPDLAFEQREHQIWIQLDSPRSSGQSVAIEIAYSGHPRQADHAPWDGGFTWSTTPSDQPWIATTVQGEGADLWWPCKDHPSDKADSFSLHINVPQPLVVASNGKLESIDIHENNTRTYHWHTDFPISNYNVALNIAPYRTIEGTFTSMDGTVVPAFYWVLPENYEEGKKLFPEFMEHLAFYERFLGPYPFRAEKYGVAETPHLGMEHQTIIAYGNNYKGGPHGYDWLHHHELGHEWWGNLVTAIDWRHFWIHEGFCTYMQALYAEEREGRMAYDHAMYTNRRKITNKHPLVPETPTGMTAINEMSGSDVYFKGSWILHTLRYLIGDDDFFICLRRMAYPDPATEKAIDGSACRFATSQDFIDIVNRVTGHDYTWFFDLYLSQPNLPRLVSAKTDQDIWIRWETPVNIPFPMPLEIQVGSTLERIIIPEKGIRLDPNKYQDALLDPNSRILKEKRLIGAEEGWLTEPVPDHP